MKRAAGIEPVSLAWEASVLPMYYARRRQKACLRPCICVNTRYYNRIGESVKFVKNIAKLHIV